MSNSKTAAALQQVLIDSYATLIQVQRFHWNIEGEDFYSWHKLSEAMYDEQFQAIDVIAERIRQLDKKPNISPEVIAKTTSVKFGNTTKDLLASQNVIAASLKKLGDIADDEDDSVTEDLVNQRLAAHEKNIWLIKTNMKNKK